MRCKWLYMSILVLSLMIAVAPASAQAVYSAEQNTSRLAVGGGISGYHPDFGGGIVLGPALWVDYKPNFFHGILNDVGLEGEARGVLWNRGAQGSGFYESTVGGGFIYHPGFARHHSIAPYVKVLGSLGWNPAYKNYGPPFLVYSLGGGVDYRFSHRITFRGDYEYQLWEGTPSSQHRGHASTDSSQGFTIGALYNFGRR
jgi:opacity protein-like surface antigen